MRFRIRKINENDFIIIDTEFKRWNMSEKAVSLHIGNLDNAEKITSVLNIEWNKFLGNPY